MKGIPKPLFSVPAINSATVGGSTFVVTRDGQRFLVLATVDKVNNLPLEVLVNWR